MQRLERLQASIKTLSKASSERAILSAPVVIAILSKATLLGNVPNPDSAREDDNHVSPQEEDMEWLLVSKATTQVYGLVLKLLLDQTIPLSRDIGYWDEVLSSYRYTALYTVQTSPLRLWDWAQDIWDDTRHMLQSTEDGSDEHSTSSTPLVDRWVQFYGLVKKSVHKRSLQDMQSKLISPLISSQSEAESKRRHLRRLREMSASGLGILVDEGIMLDSGDEDSVASKARSDEKEEWKSVVSKSVSLMEAILRNITILEMGTYDDHWCCKMI